MDVFFTQLINSVSGHLAPLDFAMIALSAWGVPLLVALVVLQWWSKTDRPHIRHSCVAAGLSFLLGLGVNQIVLLFVHRLRPYDAGFTHLIIPPSADWSFPSDHATASVAIAVSFVLARLPGRATAFAILAALIMVSRVFVGIHYAGDVLGGALTGLLAALVVQMAYREGSTIDRYAVSIL